MKIIRILAALPALLLTFDLAMAEQEPGSIASVCADCHGEGGVSRNPLVPTLAGQPYTFIEDNLLAFRAGKRACAPERNDESPAALLAQTMCKAVSGLTDEEISRLASYFQSQTFQAADQAFDPALLERGSELHREAGCEHCHSEGGRETNEMAPVLAGQWTPHLRRAMETLRDGARSGPTVMNEAIRELDDQEVEALLNYYASKQPGGTASR